MLPSPLGSLFCATPDDEDDDKESTLVFVKSFRIDDVSNTLEATLQDGTTVLDLGPVHRAAEHTADVMIGEYDYGAISLFAHQHIKVRAVAHQRCRGTVQTRQSAKALARSLLSAGFMPAFFCRARRRRICARR